MREILFRGRTESGEFAEGYYIETLLYNNLHWIWNGKEYVKVDPSTVGQFTGLTDKNGKKIFEGDIAKVLQGKDKGVACVGFESGTFMLYPITGNIYERTLWAYWYNDWDVEVVGNIHGNIHDNPELLENP